VQLAGTSNLHACVKVENNTAAMAHEVCDSNGSIIFRVASTNADITNAKFRIDLGGSTDFDYITLVSTKYLPFDS
jgi:hypothetical protein